MKTAFYIARRYLFAKKSHNVINIISMISVIGVAVGTMALIVVLSVFNGFESLVESLFNAFDPDIEITAAEGKTFIPDSTEIQVLQDHENIALYTEVVEENALLRYEDQQYIATIKGVGSNYGQLTGIDSVIIEGDFILKDDHKRNYAVVGLGVQYYLSIGLNFASPLFIYVPRENVSNPTRAFKRKDIFPSGVFSIEKEIDSKYVLVPLDFSRELLGMQNEVTGLEVEVKDKDKVKTTQKDLKKSLGDDFIIKNRFEQKAFFYKVMRSEKWAIFFILTFILIIASFNIIGSLTMLIIEKKKDMYTLQSMGANLKLIRQIFLLEGWMITLSGAIIGLVLGFLTAWMQETFELIKLQGANSFVVSAYPVEMKLSDFGVIFLTVSLIGFIAAWYPVHYITKKHISQQ